MNSDENTSKTSEEPDSMEPTTPTSSGTPSESAAGQPCACQTQANDQAIPQQFIYSLGKLDVRFPFSTTGSLQRIIFSGG
jgi:hypothetical protein